MSAAVSIAPAPLDDLHERYVLKRELGSGGMCVVHEGVHRYTERRVAIKRLLPEYVRNEEAGARLLLEATALGRVRHPCVVEAFDAGRARGVPYLVMELLEGSRSLEGLLAARGRLEVRDGVNVVRRAAEGIATAHAAGVVHRDIKPGNILLVRGPANDGSARKQTYVKVIDFGLATLVSKDDPDQKLTRLDSVLGTPEYMPLERLTATGDKRPVTDVYALGVTLYECLAGRVPFAGSYPQVLQQVAMTTPELITRARPDVHDSLARVIHKALARDADDRYQDAAEFCVALDAAMADAETDKGAPLITTTPEVPVAKRKFSRAPYITPVQVTLGGETFDARTEDVSEGGILVLGRHAFPLGVTGTMRWALPTTGDLVVSHVVLRWAKDKPENPRAPCALGLEFVNADARVRAAIAKYVSIVGE
jgi:serine/threonine protein kinase